MTDMIEGNLFGSALSEVADGPHMGSYRQITKALMERFAEKGMTLAQLSDWRMMDRSIRVLEAHAREYGIAFPDYVPMALRRKVEFTLMGDFYEVFGDGAEAVAAKLGIVATRRRGSNEPMCGVPVHSFGDIEGRLGLGFIVKIAKPKKDRKAKLAGAA